MNPRATPTYFAGLEGLRGLTAAYVVLHHALGEFPTLKNMFFMIPLRFGIEAVLVFFLLSGFVISHSTEKSASPNWPRYCALRVRRIMPIFLLGLLLSYLASSVTHLAFRNPDWWNLGANLLMLQDVNKPGIWADPFGGNGPLWSLSYEMWFYALYAVVMIRFPLKCHLLTASLISYLSIASGYWFPNAISNFGSLFLIWWVGVEMARQLRETGAVTLIGLVKPLLAMLPPVLWFAWLSYSRWSSPGNTPIYLAAHPFLEFRMYGFAFAVCMAVPLLARLKWLCELLTCKPLLFLGGISYALYVFHIPIINMDTHGIPPVASALLKAALILGLAWLAEARLQKWINSRSERFVKTLGA
jgi:peptidoglycan/LPS O-acetylase OafA/YrhL